MIKVIQFLQENPIMIQLLKEEKVSLIGVNEVERIAILEAYNEDLTQEGAFWG